MKIIHHFLNRSISEEGDCLGLLTTDNVGGYYLLANGDQSRYQGWHTLIEGQLYKIIDSILVQDSGAVQSFENRIWKIRRSFKNFFEEIILPNGFCGLYYNLSAPRNINLIFDIVKGYEHIPEGKNYTINLLDSKTFHIHFIQTTPGKNFTLDVVGKINGGKIIKDEKWQKVLYHFDQNRNSTPYEKWLFSALIIEKTKGVILSAGLNLLEAKKNLNKIYKNKKTIISKTQRINIRQVKYLKDLPQNISWILTLCRNSLKNLIVFDRDLGEVAGAYAGLPWFYQFWWRDEALALKMMFYLEPSGAKSLALRRLKNFLKLTDLNFNGTQSLDGLLLYLNNIYELDKENIGFFNLKQKKLLQSAYIHTAKLCQEIRENNLIKSGGTKTWMDSIQRSDFPVEIQFLYAAFLKNMFSLTKNSQYLKELNKLAMKIREYYFKDGVLFDGVGDDTIRPNVFLAYYFYSRILRKKEWEQVFDKALERLYLPWGGLATIDKTDRRFHHFYTGEDPQSYHQGDSWFYLNNIAAMALLDINPQKYAAVIKSIIQASSQDILKYLLPGQASELSSADNFIPSGSPSQLWSSATLLELFKKIYLKI